MSPAAIAGPHSLGWGVLLTQLLSYTGLVDLTFIFVGLALEKIAHLPCWCPLAGLWAPSADFPVRLPRLSPHLAAYSYPSLWAGGSSGLFFSVNYSSLAPALRVQHLSWLEHLFCYFPSLALPLPPHTTAHAFTMFSSLAVMGLDPLTFGPAGPLGPLASSSPVTCLAAAGDCQKVGLTGTSGFTPGKACQW